MSFRQDAARLRRQLATKGITARPTCPTCGGQIEPRHFSPHSRQCLRTAASLAIDAIARRQAEIHSTEPRGPEHKACLETEAEWLRQEHMERFNELVGLDELGRGRVTTDAP